MKERFIVKFKKFDESKDLFIPEYKSEGASGMDVMSIEDVFIPPNETRIVKTNLAVEVPIGHELQIRSRSGIAAKNGVFVLNGVGTLDSDYRGELMVILHNVGKSIFKINIGDRIAQMVLAKVERMEFYADKLSETDRDFGGFGSTGIK